MTNEEKLEELARTLFTAKKAEESAKNARIAVEEQILALIECDENKSKTVKAGDIKITVKKELGYTVDHDGLFGAGLSSAWLEACFTEVPASFKFVPKSYEALAETNPEAFKEIKKYVCIKAKKPSVSLAL